MSKQNDKKADDAIPWDFQVESKNLQYTIVLKENEIERLKEEATQKNNFILNLETSHANLKTLWVNSFNSEKELKLSQAKVESLSKEILALKEEIINIKSDFENEKKEIEHTYKNEIGRLNMTIESHHQKVEMVNQLLIDKENWTKQIEELIMNQKKIMANNDDLMRQKEVKNQIKFSNLKKKMMENINETQSKVTELNIQYMDVSTKLTLLQNHQLLIQLEYQSQQIDDLTNKKEILEKKVFEMTKDWEIHKEVELSLADKNKKLRNENQSIKKKYNIPQGGKNYNNMAESGDESSLQHENSKTSNINNYANVIALEKKVYNLEKKLTQKGKEYSKLKDNNEFIELRLRNYEKKYAGLFNFFEDSLRWFFEDEEIKSNKEIYVNIEALQHGDFSDFTKEEKYSILVILMKYLLPLVNSNDTISPQGSNVGNVNNVNLKFHYTNKRYLDDNERDIKKMINKSNNFKTSSGNAKKSMLSMTNNSVDSLPVIKNSMIGGSNNQTSND